MSPAFLSGQTTWTVWPTASIPCWNTKISYSSVNSPVSIRIFLPGIFGLLPKGRGHAPASARIEPEAGRLCKPHGVEAQPLRLALDGGRTCVREGPHAAFAGDEMSAFDLIVRLFGLLLGLAMGEVLAGLARTIRLKAGLTAVAASRVRVGWLTPLLGVLVIVSQLSFWLTFYELHGRDAAQPPRAARPRAGRRRLLRDLELRLSGAIPRSGRTSTPTTSRFAGPSSAA